MIFTVNYTTVIGGKELRLCAGQVEASAVEGAKAKATELMQLRKLKNVKIASICSKDGKEAAVAHPALLAKRVPEYEWLTVHPAYCPSRGK